MAHQLGEYKRRDVNLNRRSVREVLPEHFTSDYPDLVKFLEFYYDFINQENTNDNFEYDIKNLYSTRDISETDLANLNLIIKEVGDNLETGSLFKDARFTAKRFADFYLSKGSLNSIKEFFRAFFQEEVEVEYTKKDVFKIGESTSKIGFDSQKFIQNYGLYQTYALLIKSGIGTRTWSALYKKYVHPAGWFFQGQVVNEGQADLNLNLMPLSVEDSSVGPQIIGEGIMSLTAPFTNMTAQTLGATVDVDRNLISFIDSTGDSGVSAALIQRYTEDIIRIISPNAPTMDDSDTNAGPDMSAAETFLYTMDGVIHADSDQRS